MERSIRYCYQGEDEDLDGTIVARSSTVCTTFGRLALWAPDLVVESGSRVRVPVHVRNAGGLRIVDSVVRLDYSLDVLAFVGAASTAYAPGYMNACGEQCGQHPPPGEA